MSEAFFSADYTQARNRFLMAAEKAGAEISSLIVDAKAGLTIDVAIVAPVAGVADNKVLMVTSGVHGVEGFPGSAVQLALLDSISGAAARSQHRIVLVHAINPFGFHHLRRFNEDNIDLNRNFPGPLNDYAGSPEGYKLHNLFLNPCTQPSQTELFKLKALWKIWRYGMAPLKESIATGQYEYPQGLFYGGSAPAKSTRLVMDNLPGWLGNPDQVTHIDFHTGLGKYGQYKLLLNERQGTDDYGWYERRFDKQDLESLNNSEGTAYPVCGLFGEWAQRRFGQHKYRMIGAEFGTYNVVRVLAALRAENRAHYYSHRESALYRKAKQELVECFCPADIKWRKQVVQSGLSIIRKASL